MRAGVGDRKQLPTVSAVLAINGASVGAGDA
jgi:hypothetical protein